MQKLKMLVCLLFTCIGGIGLHTLFHGEHRKQPHKTTVVTTTATLKEQQVIIASDYQSKVDSLMQTNIELSQEVNNNRKVLQQAKHNNQLLEQKMNMLLAAAINETDTGTKIRDCDSLEYSVAELKTASHEKDSLYEAIQVDLERQVANKDSAVSLQQEKYNALQLSFDNSLAQQDDLTGMNKYLQKQLNRHIVKNKLLSGGLLVLSGVGIFSLLHR